MNDPSDRQESRCKVITGASKGIGREVARQLAERGVTVIVIGGGRSTPPRQPELLVAV